MKAVWTILGWCKAAAAGGGADMFTELELEFDVEFPKPGGDAFLDRSAVLPSISGS